MRFAYYDRLNPGPAMLIQRTTQDFLINVLLTILGYIPGIIHAL